MPPVPSVEGQNDPVTSGAEWPDLPYKGLAYYSAADSLLFACREQDVKDAAFLLAKQTTRILLLHGKTGAGKSSFLRAGLAPYLEKEGRGYQFLRAVPKDGQDGALVFIRSGADPVSRIAEYLYNYAAQPLPVETADGRMDLDLSAALLGCKNASEFVALCRTPGMLWKAFKALSTELLHTLVLIVDQLEEIITLTAAADPDRQNFSTFLREFANSPLRAKLVLSFRKEVFADIFGLIQLDASVRTDVQQFALRDLSQEDVFRAVTLPTQKTPVRGSSTAPYKKYQFEYAPGLAEKLVRELFNASSSGGVLPVMQIVCRNLYDTVRQRPRPWVITDALYEEGGSVRGRINRHISESLKAAYTAAEGQARGWGIRAPDEDAEGEKTAWTSQSWEKCWRLVLSNLIRRDSDGTTKTDVLTAGRLFELVRAQGIDDRRAGEALNFLTRPEVLILRSFSTLVGESGKETFYSLGHDVISVALLDWKLQEDEKARQLVAAAKAAARSQVWRLVLAGVAVVILGGVATLFWVDFSSVQNQQRQVAELSRIAGRLATTGNDLQVAVALEASFLAAETRRWYLPTDDSAAQVLANITAQLPRPALPWDDVGQIAILPDTSSLVASDRDGRVYEVPMFDENPNPAAAAPAPDADTYRRILRVASDGRNTNVLVSDTVASPSNDQTLSLLRFVSGRFVDATDLTSFGKPTVAPAAPVRRDALPPVFPVQQADTGLLLNRSRLYQYEYDAKLNLSITDLGTDGPSVIKRQTISTPAPPESTTELYIDNGRLIQFSRGREAKPADKNESAPALPTPPTLAVISKFEGPSAGDLQATIDFSVANQSLADACGGRVGRCRIDTWQLPRTHMWAAEIRKIPPFGARITSERSDTAAPPMAQAPDTESHLIFVDLDSGQTVSIEIARLEGMAGKPLLPSFDQIVVGGTIDQMTLLIFSPFGNDRFRITAGTDISYLGPMIMSATLSSFNGPFENSIQPSDERYISADGRWLIDGSTNQAWDLLSEGDGHSQGQSTQPFARACRAVTRSQQVQRYRSDVPTRPLFSEDIFGALTDVTTSAGTISPIEISQIVNSVFQNCEALAITAGQPTVATRIVK